MIAVLNKSTRVSNANTATMVRAVAHQLRYDAAPVWGKTPVPVVYYAHEDHVQPGAWKIVVFDDADQAGVLGWHSEGPDGLPFGRVFAGPVLDNGGDALTTDLSVASVLSHEVLEAFVDPTVNLLAEAPNGDVWALEVGDPVESDSYPVPVVLRDGSTVQVTVSDFVTPSFFDMSPPPAARFSHLAKAPAPFKLAPGGYAIVNGQAVFGEAYPAWRRDERAKEFGRMLATAHDDTPRGPIGRGVRFVDRQ